ncbi:MAG: aspartate--tRNA ligase [bacterium]|nr:aspartate--tRNA ligase [bacterium]
MTNLKRTHNCGELRLKNEGEQVILVGWINKRRDHGGLVFIDLRDREGITQIVFNPEVDDISHAQAHNLKSEFVIGTQGIVRPRPQGTVNPNLPTGEIEIVVSRLEIINSAKTPPFLIEDELNVSEDTRLKFRYLDLRRPSLQKNLILRHKVAQATRRYLDEQGFIEVETPMLIKSTPEGARDYLVPSRVNPGKFYALPQSPQLFKQILMCAGFDKYFQIVKCFRDEDLRADRQPEFTQIDIEMSFIDEEDIFKVIEGFISTIFKAAQLEIPQPPFKRITFKEAMDRYGTDAPDVRFGLELTDITDLARDSQFQVFSKTVAGGGQVKGIKVPQANFSRTDIDALISFVNIYKAKGLAWFKVKDGMLESSIAKFFTPQEQITIIDRFDAQPDDFLLFVADTPKVVASSLANLRLHLANKFNLIPREELNFTWVTEAPLVEYDEEEKRYTAVHHPFSSPHEEDYPLLETDPLNVRARAYDLVLNGIEIGGGSIRIHRRDIQERVFRLLKIEEEEAQAKFGFLLEALEYGAPPHGGIAFGLDRLLRLMVGADSIREVIAFPKTQSATCLMTDAPFEVGQKQLKELSIKLDL